ncbi:hypothetical protein [Burkholderia sp. Nafp2/4-1b]|uniref:hypothetical protein n=1 Tax=Burkholderia sp. Nafp2/4-1b TaxID=2116686 RepID=UPI0013CF2ECD|nr:hypothetical protein [Burkholderia sp. Nafp2/4-1b]
MNEIVVAAARGSGAAAVSRPVHPRTFDPMNQLVAAARRPDNSASFASVTRYGPTPIIRVPFTDA